MRLINVIIRFLCDISASLITAKTLGVVSSNFITEKGLKISVYKPYLEKELKKVVLYYHGGGWVLGSIKAYDRVLRFLSLYGNCVVVGVDYRKAPEYKFPAAIDDAYDSYKWAMNNIILLKEKPESLIVCGDSAGGNLAINLFKRLHEKGENALFKFILIYPLLVTKITKYEGIKLKLLIHKCSEKILEYFLKQYLNHDNERNSSYLSLLDNFDKNLPHPETFILLGEQDALNDGIKQYARKLIEAGIDVKTKEYKNQIHGFINFSRFSKGAGLALQDIVNHIKN